MPPKKKLTAGPGGVIGPDGSYVKPGDPIPVDWPKAVVDSLVETGGAK